MTDIIRVWHISSLMGIAYPYWFSAKHRCSILCAKVHKTFVESIEHYKLYYEEVLCVITEGNEAKKHIFLCVMHLGTCNI